MGRDALRFEESYPPGRAPIRRSRSGAWRRWVGHWGAPRLGMTGIFLSLSRILPDMYPLGEDTES